MQRFLSYLDTACKIISDYEGEIPFAQYIKNFFKAHRKAGSQDRKNIAQLCYGYFRIGNTLSNEPVKEQILKGLFLNSSSPSQLLEQLCPQWAKQVTLPITEKQSLISNTNHWLIFPARDQLNQDLPVQEFENSHFVKPLHFMRVRPGNENLINRLELEGLPIIKLSDSCIAWEQAIDMEKYVLLNKEAVIQDLSSQQVAGFFPFFANASAPVSVWDCCAASGGKSILAYDTIPSVKLYASDVRVSMLVNLRKRLLEAGITGAESRVLDLGGDTKNKWPFGKKNFDLIIADVPCTGSGTWGRAPENLRFFRPNQITEYTHLQKKIMNNAVKHMERGGYLLYITCSVYRQENEEQVNWLQVKNGLKVIKAGGIYGYSQRADSMYAALLKSPD